MLRLLKVAHSPLNYSSHRFNSQDSSQCINNQECQAMGNLVMVNPCLNLGMASLTDKCHLANMHQGTYLSNNTCQVGSKYQEVGANHNLNSNNIDHLEHMAISKQDPIESDLSLIATNHLFKFTWEIMIKVDATHASNRQALTLLSNSLYLSVIYGLSTITDCKVCTISSIQAPYPYPNIRLKAPMR